MADTQTTYRTVTPYLLVPDADHELTFLKAAFGAREMSCHRGPENRVMHAEIMINDSLIMIGQAGGEWKPVSGALYLWGPDVDATYAAALRTGATSQQAPEDMTYGHRNASVLDPNGISWWIAAAVKK